MRVFFIMTNKWKKNATYIVSTRSTKYALMLKEMVALLVQKGIVTVKDGKPVMEIPYFTRAEYDRFLEILDNQILPEVEAAAGTDLARKYAAYIAPYLPAYLSEGEREFVKNRFYVPNAISYLLYKEGKLKEPSAEEKKRLCMIAWENRCV